MLLLDVSSALKSPKHLFIAIESIQQAEFYFTEADQETLIIFDIDSTLTTPSDPNLRRQAIKKYKSIYNQHVLPLTKDQNRLFNHLLVSQSPSQLVEAPFPSIIKKLQERGIKTIALTASKTGNLGPILPSFPEWRYSELKRLGIDFSQIYPGKVLFKQLRDYGKDHPGMEKGIVYCGHQAKKGALLKLVLAQLNWIPKKIIFVDDKLENLESLSQSIQEDFPSIYFIGIHYKGMESFPLEATDVTAFNAKISKLVKEAKSIN